MTIGKPVVYGLLGAIFGLPLLLMALFGTPKFGTYLLVPLPGGDIDASRLKSLMTATDTAFAGGATAAAARLAAMRRMLTTKYEVSSNNRGLVVAVVSITDPQSLPKGERRRIDVDFAETSKAALLVIADQPVVWAARNAKPEHRAKFAVESQAVFDVADLRPGMFAGFRSRAFGSGDVTGPRDLERDDNRSAKVRFCSSLKAWIGHFEVPVADVRVWEISNPTQINLVGDKVTSTGGKQRRPFYASDYCR